MLEFENLSVSAGEFQLQGVSLSIPSGSYAVLMGKTGSGKTTLMESLCGLRQVQSGRILLDDHDITQLRPGERGIGYVPQDTVLFSNMTVWKHLAFGPQIQGWKKDQISDRVEEIADALGITQLLPRKPHGLSGGEAKRVALGRALTARPGVLCLDEPLSALDEDTNDEICDLLKSIQRGQNVIVFHITHNKREAERLADVRFEMDTLNGVAANDANCPANRDPGSGKA